MQGNVYVWGAGKYGLLGNPKQEKPISKPIKLQLKSEKLVLERSGDQNFVATTISYGHHHAAVVVNDVSTNSEFIPLTYAQGILRAFKNFLKRHWDTKLSSKLEHSIYDDEGGAIGELHLTEDFIIEHTLKDLFLRQLSSFPFITVTSLKEAMVYEAKLAFEDTVSYNRLFSDLQIDSIEANIPQSLKGGKYLINLK